MNINEKFEFNSSVPFNEKYDAVINLLGKENIANIIPWSPQELSEAIKKDKNLNNIPLKQWDKAAGIYEHGIHYSVAGTLPGLLCKNGITSFSPSELVCILKECAKQIAEDYDNSLNKETDDMERE